jgi:hypothetical protein
MEKCIFSHVFLKYLFYNNINVIFMTKQDHTNPLNIVKCYTNLQLQFDIVTFLILHHMTEEFRWAHYRHLIFTFSHKIIFLRKNTH